MIVNARQPFRIREEDELAQAQSTLAKAERAMQRKRNKHWTPVWKELKKSIRSRTTLMRQRMRWAK